MQNGSEASTSQPQVFLSYSRADSAEVSKFNEELRKRVPTFFDADAIGAGDFWPDILETALRRVKGVAVFLGPSGLGPWQKREVFFAIDRQVAEESANRFFPVIPIVLPQVQHTDLKRGFLSLYNWVDLRKLERLDAIEAVARALHKESDSDGGAAAPKVCPYLGLARFTELDAPLYFGREAFAQQLFDKVQQHELTTVVGASGSGKSSLVFAGLIPLLRRQSNPTWEALSFTPGDDPWRGLANAFMEFVAPGLKDPEKFGSFQEEASKLANNLRTDPSGLRSSVESLLKLSQGSNRLLMIVDQFEELFTLTPPTDRLAFLDFLLKAGKLATTRVALTLRADYYASAIDLNPEFTARLVNGQVTLAPMDDEQLLRAVTSPAKLVGLSIEPALLDQIKIEMQGQANSLPLLEHALVEVWKRGGSKLTFDNYVAVGRIAGAISKSADDLYKKLKPEEQDAARRLFLQLVRTTNVGQEGSETRARANKSDLDDLCWSVALKFADPLVRLLVISAPVDSGNTGEGHQTVEVAHEALIRSWERFKKWIEEDHKFLIWRQALALKMSEWERTGRTEAGLLSGVFLEEASKLIESRGKDLNQAEIAYITLPLGDHFQISKTVFDGERIAGDAQPEAVAFWKTLLCVYRPEYETKLADYPEQTARNLATITLQRADPERALELAKFVNTSKSRGELLASIALSFAQIGNHDRLLFVVSQVREIVPKIKGTYGDQQERQPVLSKVFGALAHGHQTDLALEIAKQFEQPSETYVATAAAEFLSAGKWQDALELTTHIAKDYEREQALLNLLKPSCDPVAAEAISRRYLSQLPKDFSFPWKLQSLASALVQSGNVGLALSLAREQNQENGERAAALIALGRALITADRNRAAELSEEAWQSALLASDARRKDLLVNAVELWADTDGITSVLHAARDLKSDVERSYALIQAAAYYSHTKQKTLATDVLTEAESAVRQIVGYERNNALIQIVGLYFELDRVPEASAAARTSANAYERGQIYTKVLDQRLKDLQLAHLDAIQQELLQAVLDDDSSYMRETNLRKLLTLPRDKSEDISGISELFQIVQNATQRRALSRFIVWYVRENYSANQALELIRSIDDLTERDWLLSDYVRRLPADTPGMRQLVAEIRAGEFRDEAINHVAPIWIESGMLEQVRELFEKATGPRLKNALLSHLAVAYGNAGQYTAAVDPVLELANADPALAYQAIRQMTQWKDLSETQEGARKIREGIYDFGASGKDAPVAVRLLILAHLASSEQVSSLLNGDWLKSTARKQKHAQKQPGSPVKVAENMMDPQVRSYAFAALTVAYARAGDADAAAAMADHLAVPEMRSQTLADAAWAAPQADVQSRVAEKGIAFARSLSDEYQRRQALTFFVPLLARRRDSARAIEVAREAFASDAEFINCLIKQVSTGVDVQAAEAFRAEALQSILKLSNSWEQQAAFQSLALALIEAGFYAEALDITQRHVDEAARTKLLITEVEALTKQKAADWAEKAAVLALRGIESTPPYSQQDQKRSLINTLKVGGLDQTALSIARQLAPKPGTPEHAKAIAPILVATGFVKEAVELANTLPDLSARREFLAGLMPLSGSTADREAARVIGHEVFLLWAFIENFRYYGDGVAASNFGAKLAEARLWEFVSELPEVTHPAARAAIFTGQTKGWLQKGNSKLALGAAENALRACAGMQDNWERPQVIANLLAILAKANLLSSLDFAPYVKSLSFARDLSAAFEKAGLKDEAHKIVKGLPAQNEEPPALEQIALQTINQGDLDIALELTRAIPDTSIRIKLHARIANLLIDNQRMDLAEKIAGSAEMFVSQIGDYDERAHSWARIAQVWANLRHYQHSRQLAENCYKPTERLLVYCSILRSYLVSINPELSPALATVPTPDI